MSSHMQPWLLVGLSRVGHVALASLLQCRLLIDNDIASYSWSNLPIAACIAQGMKMHTKARKLG